MAQSDAPLAKEVMHLSELWEKEISKESARGQIMLGTALLDDLLRDLLESSVRPEAKSNEIFSGPTAPFSSFSNRIQVCFALGLLDVEERNCLNLLRKIRNDFAHRFDASFGDVITQNRLKAMNECFPAVNERESRDYIEQARDLVKVLGIRIKIRTRQSERENPALLVDKSLEEALRALLDEQ